MADNRLQIRRRAIPERDEYRRGLEFLANFVDNELGNVPARPRPNTEEWRIQRVKTIRKINEFKEKLDMVCVGANYGKAAGSGSEILGAFGTIVGSTLSLFGVPAGQTIVNIGNMVHHGGTLVDGVSNIIESLVSSSYLSEIEAVLERDKALSRPLEEWLQFSRELDNNIELLFGVSLANERWNIIIKTFYKFSELVASGKSFDATLSLMRQGRYSVYIGNDVKLANLQKLFQHLTVCPNFSGRIRVALSVLSVATGSLQVFREGTQIYYSLAGINSNIIPSLQGGLNPEMPSAKAVSVFCIFKAIGMALSVMSFINAVSIIKNGHSKYSDALGELARLLTLELRRMEEL